MGADTLQEGGSTEADEAKIPPGATAAYLAEADMFDGARAAFEYNPSEPWTVARCMTVRGCQVKPRLEYTYDTGCFDTTILAIFRPFSAVFGPFSPS